MANNAPSPDQVRAALDEILGWSELARSPQLSRFLKHIVDAKLRGDEAGIKAYSIAVDVFGRPAGFDPQTDPIVRVRARRLRGLLQEFYRQDLAKTGVRITLPVGRYVPEFDLTAPEQPVQVVETVSPALMLSRSDAPRRLGRRFWLQAGAAMALVLALGALLIGLQVLRPMAPAVSSPDMPQEPTVFIADFTNLTAIPNLDVFASHLNDQLSSVLAQFEDVQVGFLEPGQPLAKAAGSYLLSGTILAVDTGIEVAAVLTDAMTGTAVWSQNVTQPMPVGVDTPVVSNVARKIMREIGPFRGPVHARGRKWLDDNMPQIPAVNGYVCLLTYRYARESINPAAIAKALDCHERLLAEQPDLPLAIAAEAWLEGRVIYGSASPDDRIDIALAEPAEMASRARSLAPESSFAHEQLASIQNWQENFEMAQRNYAISLGFEPLNTDARANYANTLARGGDWTGARQQAQFAIADASFPSPWYHYLPALIALRDGRFAQAVLDGRIAAQSGELGSVVALAAAALGGDNAARDELRPLVLSMESLRRSGILPWVTRRIKDPQVLARLRTGLLAGGVPEEALTASF